MWDEWKRGVKWSGVAWRGVAWGGAERSGSVSGYLVVEGNRHTEV